MGTKRDIRTTSAERQWQFDNVLADTDISGLKFLKNKYKDNLAEYFLTHDLNNPESLSEYQEMQQRYKMINEELKTRYDIIENESLYSRDVHFNDNYDIVFKEDDGEIKVIRPSLSKDGSIDFLELDESDVRD